MNVQSEARAEALTERLFGATLGLMELATIYIGDELGFYEELDRTPGATAAEIAERTGTHERYVREWLEHQAASGLIDVDDAEAVATERRYRLQPGTEEVFLDARSLSFATPFARYGVGMVRPIDRVVDAFRNGGGVSAEAYGRDVREAQAAVNRPQFEQFLTTEWLPAMPDVEERLLSDPPARVADIACGGGWSSIVMAKQYPRIEVDGFDFDGPSIELARANAKAAGVGDRVRFHARDAGDPELGGRYDLVTVFEAIHDMSDPVAVLEKMRSLAGPGGSVLVVDERTADRFTAPADEMERLLYGFSVLLCLPNGMAEQPSAATGTVMRSDTLRRYALLAGFVHVKVLPVEHPQFRLYRLYA